MASMIDLSGYGNNVGYTNPGMMIADAIKSTAQKSAEQAAAAYSQQSGEKIRITLDKDTFKPRTSPSTPHYLSSSALSARKPLVLAEKYAEQQAALLAKAAKKRAEEEAAAAKAEAQAALAAAKARAEVEQARMDAEYARQEADYMAAQYYGSSGDTMGMLKEKAPWIIGGVAVLIGGAILLRR